MTEYEETIQLANRVLERPSGDPDDDLAMLSRQFLRKVESERAGRDENRSLRSAIAHRITNEPTKSLS
jgi:hypothetical protein